MIGGDLHGVCSRNGKNRTLSPSVWRSSLINPLSFRAAILQDWQWSERDVAVAGVGLDVG